MTRARKRRLNFYFPANETRKVDLEFQGQRTPLTFVPGDSLRVASVSLALSGGEYACLWVGELSYLVWVEKGKPWTARFKGISGILKERERRRIII